MSTDGSKALAAVRLHPFVIVTGALMIGGAGSVVWRLDAGWAATAPLQSLGKGLLGLGVVTLVFAYGAMAQARTTINPRRPTKSIVSGGIYRLSRNPIYVGWFLFLLGQGLRNASVFEVLVAVLTIGLLHWAVVLPEERYLEDAFGEAYLQYKRSVRRWL